MNPDCLIPPFARRSSGKTLPDGVAPAAAREARLPVQGWRPGRNSGDAMLNSVSLLASPWSLGGGSGSGGFSACPSPKGSPSPTAEPRQTSTSWAICSASTSPAPEFRGRRIPGTPYLTPFRFLLRLGLWQADRGQAASRPAPPRRPPHRPPPTRDRPARPGQSAPPQPRPGETATGRSEEPA